MAVDDAELLALAGDSSDDESPQESAKQIKKAASPLPSIEISRDDSDKFAAKFGQSSTKKPRAGQSSTKTKGRKEDSEEEGDL